MRELEQFLTLVTLLRPSKETAEIYGQIRLQLSSVGTPIPENDIWIAATAMQYDLPILTNDKHFNSVDGITVQMMKQIYL
jgi:tRNA(fMet)-specific endonuclease VapC